MQISFFEEFPTKENLSKLKLVSWPAKLYLAAKSLEEFNQIKLMIKSRKIKEIVYWPILNRKEGYWISPFSDRTALKKVFSELKDQKIPVMLDLELPTTQNPWLYLAQSLNFFKNRKLIRDFINNYFGTIYLAEYYPEGKRKEKVLSALGLHYYHQKTKIIKMIYHSLHDFNEEFLIQELQRGKKEFKDNFIVALGTIAAGIHGKEPVLSWQQLEQDLKLAQKAGIKEVVIFRLGGLNRKHIKIVKNLMLN